MDMVILLTKGYAKRISWEEAFVGAIDAYVRGRGGGMRAFA